jgi:hypothetical protein
VASSPFLRSLVVDQERGIPKGLAMQIDHEWPVTIWKVAADQAGGGLDSCREFRRFGL